MNTTNEIKDFGQKIGGAKKDMWRNRSLSIEDVDILDDIDRKKFIKKDMVWKKPDYQKMKEDGVPVTVIYFIKTIRDAIPTSPFSYDDETVQNYINGINFIQESLQNLRVEDIESYYEKVIKTNMVLPSKGWYVIILDEYRSIVTNKFLRATQTTISHLNREIRKKQFLFTEEEVVLADYEFRKYSTLDHSWDKDYNDRIQIVYKPARFATFFMYPEGEYAIESNWQNDTWYAINTKKHCFVAYNYSDLEELQQFVLDNANPTEKKKKAGKKRYNVKKLSVLTRKGDENESPMCLPEFLQITGDNIINEFNIKGGEFGVWVSDDEKQLNMNWAYLSFIDLAAALDIPCSSVSINGELSIAFGSRGSGNALAHYELDRRVINLTRMKGAGSLAHEWGHAIDFIAKDTLGRKYYDVTKKLRGAFWYKKDSSSQSDFFINSQKMDKMYSKSGHGYWSSTEELFARAFACYVADKLEEKGRHNLYLHGHSEDAVTIDGEYAVPKGEERQYINECFDEYFKTLINEGVL